MRGSLKSTLNRIIAYNVRSLPAKLSFLLSWPVSLFLLSEVRVSTPRQKALSRAISGQMCSVVWGAAPPPSPTFSVSPGGVAIIARQPWIARPYPIPSLSKWCALARVVSAKIAHPTCGEMLCIFVYGFPESHPCRSMNEHMLKDILSAMASVNMPTYMGGDMTVSISNSEALSLSESLGIVCVSPTKMPTTMGRSGDPGESPPIDLVFANLRARDMVQRSRVNHAITLSDHYPVEIELSVPRCGFSVMGWPKTIKLGEKKRDNVPFPLVPLSTSFKQWQKLAMRWLSVTFETKIPPKHRVRVTKYKQPKLPIDVPYRQLLALQAALQHIIAHGETLQRKRSIHRKCRALDSSIVIRSTTYVAMRDEVHTCMQEYVKRRQKDSLNLWLQLARKWKASSREACRFVKNPSPCQVTVVNMPNGATVDPNDVQKHLSEYWKSIETWPIGRDAESVADLFEDKYSMFLPRMVFDVPLTSDILYMTARSMKKSSPGLDAWTTSEVKHLPRIAWDQFLHIFNNRPHELESELTTLVKRVPLEKKEGLCTPRDVRPIDLFSVLLRLVSSATYNLIRPWMQRVLHPNQHATTSGALQAAAKIAWRTEQSWANLQPTYAIACDFTKMFNMLSMKVASQAAEVMGLSHTLADTLTKPLRISAFTWKLPFGAKAIEEKLERGIPQGMGGSVAMAEIVISALLWKCQVIMNCDPDPLIVAYVDDVNLFLADPDILRRVVRIVCEFTQDLALDLSLEKTNLVGSDQLTLTTHGREYGITAAATLHALGAEWPTNSSAKPNYAKEEARMDEFERRLMRARNLPLSFVATVDTVSTACLSLLDYINHPKPTRAKALRSLVKKTLGHYHAAPEILFNAFLTTSLDPCIRWLLAIARMWHAVLQHSPQEAHVNTILRRSQTRLGSGAVTLLKYNVRVCSVGFHLSDAFYGKETPWNELRPKFIEHLKMHEYAALATRRPAYYGGMTTCAVKAHRKLLRSLAPYEQSTLVRIWTGAVMTKAKNSQMYGSDPTCACGHENQDMEHLLWHCSLSPPIPDCLAYRATLAPSQSIAHILPVGSSSRDEEYWRQSCKRAVAIVNGQSQRERAGRTSDEGSHEVRDTKGHQVATTVDGLYVYCVKCFIARCSRDAKWIFSRPCLHSMRDPTVEGQTVEDHGHICTMQMATWKLSSQRPQLRCTECGQRAWATSGFRKFCRGVG